MKIKLFLAYIFEFLRDGFYLGLFLLLPFISKDIHLTLFQAGSLQTTVNLLAMILAIPTVSLLIRFGEIRMLLFSVLLYAIGFLAFFFSHSYGSLLIIYALMGISFGFYATISGHITATWFEKHNRGEELGKLMAVGDVAKVIFSLGIGFFAGVIGWRFTSLSIGFVTGIVFIVFSFLFLRSLKNASNEKVIKDEDIIHAPYRFLLRQKKLLLALITSALDQGINAPFYAFLPFLLLYKGVSLQFVGALVSIYYIGNIVSRLVFGKLVDRIGNAQIVIFLELTMATVIFLMVISSSLLVVSFLSLILGFVTEGTDPATGAMMAEAVDAISHPQKASGMRSLGNGIAKVVFPFALGFIANSFGILWGFSALAFATLLPIIPAWIFLRNKTSSSNNINQDIA